MHSRRGSTLLIMLSAVASAVTILHLKLGSAPCGSSFARPPRRFGLAPPHGWPLKGRLECLHRNSFFSKSNGDAQVTADRRQRPLLYDKDEIDLDQRANTPIGFGKHKFMTYGEMVRDDPHYCAHIAELQDVRDDQVEVHDFQDYLEAIKFKVPLSFPQTSRSRHAGKTFKEVMETHPLYCSWVFHNEARGLRRFRNFLEDEGFEPLDVKEIIPSGVHKGKTYSKVMREHPSYCTWVRSLQDDVNGALVDLQSYLEEQGFEDVVQVGKHSGKSFAEVMADDPSYCSWVMSLGAEEDCNSSDMLIFKQHLEQNWLSSEDLITSGKYSGKSFEEVMREDPSYCAWVMRTGMNSPSMLKFKSFLKSQEFSLPISEEIVEIGMHKGKTFEDLMAEDPSYCAWVMSLSAEEGSVMLRLKDFLQRKGFKLEDTIIAGQHEGKTFEEVMTEDPSYCGWVMRLSGAEENANSSVMLRFKSFLERKGFSLPPSEDTLVLGQHKGKTFEEVMTEDPSYCQWVMSECGKEGSDSHVLLRFKHFLQSKGFSTKGIMTAGKHNGKTFEEVMTEDPLYCTWVIDLIKEGKNIPAMLTFRDFLEDRGFQSAEDVMTAGKHKGKTFEEVMAVDPSYCTSVLRLVAGGTQNSVMLRLAKFLEKQRFSLPLSEEVLEVGKHKGKTFQEVMAEDPFYCTWAKEMSAEDAIASNMLGFQRFLEERRFRASAEDMMTVGKHRGKTFEKIVAEDPIYCTWVLDPSSDSAGSPVMLRLKKFLEEMGFEALSENVMTFGKHRGKTFEEMMKDDPAYCKFLMRRIAKDGTNITIMLRLKNFLEKQRFALPLPEEVLLFGKHKGKTFEEVITEDPIYCSWVMDLCKNGTSNATAFARFKEYLEERGFSAPPENVLTTGKHRGKTFKEVMTDDPSYCEWVMNLRKEGTDTIAILRFKRFLEDNGFQAPSSGKMSRATADSQTSNTVPLGMHQGKSFEEVVKEDPSYCSWVMTTSSSPALQSFKSYLLEHGFAVPS